MCRTCCQAYLTTQEMCESCVISSCAQTPVSTPSYVAPSPTTTPTPTILDTDEEPFDPLALLEKKVPLVAGAVVGVAVLVILILYFFCCRKKGSEDGEDEEGGPGLQLQLLKSDVVVDKMDDSPVQLGDSDELVDDVKHSLNKFFSAVEGGEGENGEDEVIDFGSPSSGGFDFDRVGNGGVGNDDDDEFGFSSPPVPAAPVKTSTPAPAPTTVKPASNGTTTVAAPLAAASVVSISAGNVSREDEDDWGAFDEPVSSLPTTTITSPAVSPQTSTTALPNNQRSKDSFGPADVDWAAFGADDDDDDDGDNSKNSSSMSDKGEVGNIPAQAADASACVNEVGEWDAFGIGFEAASSPRPGDAVSAETAEGFAFSTPTIVREAQDDTSGVDTPSFDDPFGSWDPSPASTTVVSPISSPMIVRDNTATMTSPRATSDNTWAAFEEEDAPAAATSKSTAPADSWGAFDDDTSSSSVPASLPALDTSSVAAPSPARTDDPWGAFGEENAPATEVTSLPLSGTSSPPVAPATEVSSLPLSGASSPPVANRNTSVAGTVASRDTWGAFDDDDAPEDSSRAGESVRGDDWDAFGKDDDSAAAPLNTATSVTTNSFSSSPVAKDPPAPAAAEDGWDAFGSSATLATTPNASSDTTPSSTSTAAAAPDLWGAFDVEVKPNDTDAVNVGEVVGGADAAAATVTSSSPVPPPSTADLTTSWDAFAMGNGDAASLASSEPSPLAAVPASENSQANPDTPIQFDDDPFGSWDVATSTSAPPSSSSPSRTSDASSNADSSTFGGVDFLGDWASSTPSAPTSTGADREGDAVGSSQSVPAWSFEGLAGLDLSGGGEGSSAVSKSAGQTPVDSAKDGQSSFDFGNFGDLL